MRECRKRADGARERANFEKNFGIFSKIPENLSGSLRKVSEMPAEARASKNIKFDLPVLSFPKLYTDYMLVSAGFL